MTEEEKKLNFVEKLYIICMIYSNAIERRVE